MKYLIIVLSILSIGCATIFKGSSAEVRFNSTPSGADIFINGIDKGATPSTLNLKRNNNYIVTLKKDGYKDVKLELNKKFDGGTTIVGNIFSWWLLGIVVDVASGAAYSLTPADIHGNLEKMEQLGIIDTDKVSKDGVHVVMLTQEQWNQIQASK